MRSIKGMCGAVGVSAALLLGGCGKQDVAEPSILKDSDLNSSQSRLLTEAFEIATAIPVTPHIKDRSRTQEKVINGCLDLDLPVRALAYAEKVDNWRRGLDLANIAYYSVEHGVTNQVDTLLNTAEQIGKSVTSQEWRRDLVLGHVKATRDLLNKPSEEPEQSATLDEADFDEQMKSVDELFKIGDLDNALTAMAICRKLYGDYYGNEQLRSVAEQKVRAAWKGVPYLNRIDFMKALAEIALEHQDEENALRIVDDADDIVNGMTWPVNYEIPVRADLAVLRFKSGDVDKAVAELNGEKALFEERGEEVVNIDRADALIPLAEAYSKTGDSSQSLEIYTLATESAVLNANSRPRAEDLSAICLSMALNKVEPSDALWKRLETLKANLGDPW